MRVSQIFHSEYRLIYASLKPFIAADRSAVSGKLLSIPGVVMIIPVYMVYYQGENGCNAVYMQINDSISGIM